MSKDAFVPVKFCVQQNVGIMDIAMMTFTRWISVFLFVFQGLHHGDMSLLVSSLHNCLTLWNISFSE